MKTKVKPKTTNTAKEVLERRYLLKDLKGKIIETPEELFERVAKHISQAEKNYPKGPGAIETEDKFYEMMASFDFLPNSPTLMNSGKKLGQLSGCFVLPIKDSMADIFESIKNAALIHKSGGGTGFSFSRLRQKGALVHKTQGVASGPISFMTAFNAATETVKQGGTRRGANMGMLRVDHPDIMDFITCKEDQKQLNNFNISVAATEKFMDAIEKGADYDLIDPQTKKKTGSLNAQKVFDLIVKQSWKNGEPGIIFIDRMNRDNPTPEIGEIESTNPCGEQPLLPYESCNLGSINLSRFVRDGKIDYPRLRDITRLAVRFLDDVVDMNKYPLPEISEMTMGNRKIGLGVMGFADMLLEVGVSYNSDKAVEVAAEVMKFIQDEGRKMSEELAEEKGVFPNWQKSIYAKKNQKLRNAAITTIAPTGTISMIADASSGVEPLFAVSFIKNVMDKDELVMTNPIFLKTAKEKGFYSEALMKEIASKGTLHEIKEIPENIRKVYVVAHDITPEWHIKIQAAFQKYTDNAVSKTVNFSHSATEKDVVNVYKMAYKTGCKGVTIYRDGSRDEQVLNIGGVNKEEDEKEQEKKELRDRPKVTTGQTIKMKTGCGNLYVTLNRDEEGRPFEVFTAMGKAGGCAAAQGEAIGRMVSVSLRSGVEPVAIIKHLKSITCHRPIGLGGNRITSCADAISKALELFLAPPTLNLTIGGNPLTEPSLFAKVGDVKTHAGKPSRESYIGGICKECGGPIEYEGGCLVCRSCGYSECA